MIRRLRDGFRSMEPPSIGMRTSIPVRQRCPLLPPPLQRTRQ
jgi:hypothetical protein